jgi:hypothetical protein
MQLTLGKGIGINRREISPRDVISSQQKTSSEETKTFSRHVRIRGISILVDGVAQHKHKRQDSELPGPPDTRCVLWYNTCTPADSRPETEMSRRAK